MTAAPAPQSAAAIGQYRLGLLDKAQHVRLEVLAKLIGQPQRAAKLVQEVSNLMADPSQSVRELAVTVLGQAGQAGVNGLIQGLHPQQKFPVRVLAANTLGRLGPDAQDAVKPLCQTINIGNDDLRWQASFALGQIGEPAVESLISLLTGTDETKVKIACVDALGWVGPAAQPSMQELESLIQDQDSPMPLRLAACSALIRITEDASQALPFMIEQLSHEAPEVRQAALDRIAELLELGQEAQGDIMPLLSDPAAPVRAAAALGLVKIKADPGDTVQAVVTPLLDDPDPEVRASVGMVLHAYASYAEPALTKLKALTRDDVDRVAAIARAAIKKIVEEQASGADHGQETG